MKSKRKPELSKKTMVLPGGSKKDFFDFVAEYRTLIEQHIPGRFTYESDFRPYMLVAHRQLEGIVGGLPKGGHILDIGCGRGHFAAYLAVRGLRVSGVEVRLPRFSDDLFFQKDPNAIKHYQALWRSAKARYGPSLRYFDGIHFPYPDESFDALLFYASFEHVPVQQLQELCGEAHRILKPGGKVYIFRCPSSLAWTEHLAKLLKMGNHEKLYGASEIRGILAKAGLRVTKIRRSDFFPEHFKPLQAWLNRMDAVYALAEGMINLTPLRLFSHHFEVFAERPETLSRSGA